MSAGRLPNFLIVGAPRCGTTSLAIWLGEHPDVFFSSPKELHFFNKGENYERGLGWYREQFAGARDETAVGEGTPNYMLPTHVIDRIADALPDLKLIACLREPVARAYSNWQLHRALGIEPRDFDRAISEELAAARDPLERPWRTWRDAPGIGMDYVARGQYLPQLERLAQVWGRDRLHVTLLDDIGAAPLDVFAAACSFLGVDAGFAPPSLGRNFNSIGEHAPGPLERVRARLPGRPRAGGADRARDEPMSAATRAHLAAHFAPHNAALAEWLGRDLTAWRVEA